MSHIKKKPAFWICEYKGTDQLCGNCAGDQRLCFHYIDSTISLFPKSETSSLLPSSAVVQPGLCRTWSEIQKSGFFAMQHMILVEVDVFDN